MQGYMYFENKFLKFRKLTDKRKMKERIFTWKCQIRNFLLLYLIGLTLL